MWLFISETHPFLGASPDGLLGEKTLPYHEIRNGEYHLKKNHPYYYQIQGQLFYTNRKYCNMIIYTFVNTKVVYVYWDEPFILDMINKLNTFYENHFKKAILEKSLYKNYNKLIYK